MAMSGPGNATGLGGEGTFNILLNVTCFVTFKVSGNFAPIMHNTRFATLIHILTLLAKSPGQWLSSDWIASSILVHPAMVRKELGVLHRQGWIRSKKGKDGGSMLAVPPQGISLADIFKAVKNSNVLGRKNNCQGTKCPVGKDINRELDALFTQTDEIVFRALGTKSLQGFVDQFE